MGASKAITKQMALQSYGLQGHFHLLFDAVNLAGDWIGDFGHATMPLEVRVL